MILHSRRSKGLDPLKNVNLPPAALHRNSHGNNKTNIQRLLAAYAVPVSFLVILVVYLATFGSYDFNSITSGPDEYNGVKSTENVPSLLGDVNNNNNSLRNNNIDDGPPKVAHVVSLITCHKASRVKGFLDAFIILRHSIHQNSIHAHPDSKYSYQMYVIIHEDGGCTEHADLLKRLGYIPIIKPTPVDITKLPEGWYKNHVESENCCGSKEFIKLYAYALTQHPVVVHWDLDTAVLQPMDELYDSILYDKDSPIGKAARAKLAIQRPKHQKLPDRIDAFITRDVTSAQPTETIQAVQGGFVVVRPKADHLEMYKKFIMEADYKPGRGPGSGWGGLGYGGFQGAMAYQGVLAYFYDHVYPGHHVELDVCRWNQVVADVIWRGPHLMEYNGTCRDFPSDGNYALNTPENGACEDCRILPISETKTAHYTACKKPWDCAIPYPRNPRDKRQVYRLQHLTNITTCGLLFNKYFDYRRDVEAMIEAKISVAVSSRDGTYAPEYFKGYCKRAGEYMAMENIPDDFDMKTVYGF